MKKELDEALCKDFPLIFRNRHTPRTLMCWGFDCNNGWEPIIRTLCESFMSKVYSLEEDVSMYERWLDTDLDVIKKESIQKKLEDTKAKLEEAKDQVPVAVQIKEKFATLRFYTNYQDDYVHGVIRMAESMSACTCENCGKPGKLCNKNYWLKTLCTSCARKFKFKDNKK